VLTYAYRYVANQAVVKPLQKQVHEENLLQKSIVIMQQNSAHFEEGIVRAIQSAWQTFDEWQSRASAAIQDTYRTLSTHLGALAPDKEWISHAARSDHLLDPETPLRNPETIIYPNKDDPAVSPVHTGLLERKKRFTRTYREAYYVLTPAGFLHEFATSDPAAPGGQSPTFSLFLPACTLGPPSPQGSRSHKFHIEGRKDGTGATKTGSFRLNSGIAWSFRSRSREDMMEWWNDIRMLCARYLVASEQIERDGPVAAAVRAVGYTSEDEEEVPSSGEEEGEGEGEGEDGGEDYYVDVPTQEEISHYVPPERNPAERVAANGYPVEQRKSGASGSMGNGPRTSSPDHDERNEPSVNGTLSGRPRERASDHAESGYDVDGVQQDTEQHGASAEAAPASAESRFTEDI